MQNKEFVSGERQSYCAVKYGSIRAVWQRQTRQTAKGTNSHVIILCIYNYVCVLDIYVYV